MMEMEMQTEERGPFKAEPPMSPNASATEKVESNYTASESKRPYRVLARTVDEHRKPILREEWLRIRRAGIGGSEAATIAGYNPYGSLLGVYADKLGLVPEQEDNEAMRTGRDLEDYVAHRFMEATGKQVRRCNAVLQSIEHPFMIANVDRLLVGEDAGLECKTTGASYDWEGGTVNDAYILQMQHYMAVTGKQKWYLAVLVANHGYRFYWYEVPRNEETIAGLIEAEKEFWTNHVQACIPPDPDGSESCDKTLRLMYAADPALESVQLDAHEDTVARLLEAKEMAKVWSQQADALQQQIEAAMGSATIAQAGKYKTTWKQQTTRRLDTKRLKAEQPDIYAEYTKETTTRVFRASAPKEAS